MGNDKSLVILYLMATVIIYQLTVSIDRLRCVDYPPIVQLAVSVFWPITGVVSVTVYLVGEEAFPNKCPTTAAAR